MIMLDNDVLQNALEVETPAAFAIQRWFTEAIPLCTNTIVWMQFLQGNRRDRSEPEVARAIRLVGGRIEEFTVADAKRAAQLFNQVQRNRQAMFDCAIAAVAIRLETPLATQNLDDFRLFRQFGLKLQGLDE